MLTAVFTITMIVTFGSLVFDGIALYWHRQERRARLADEARLDCDEARLDADEKLLKRGIEPER